MRAKTNISSVVQRWKQQGVRVYDEHKTRLLPVDSPSYRDIMTKLDVLSNEIKGSKSRKEYQKVEKLKADEELVLPFLESTWRDISRAITRRQKERHTIKKFLHGNEDGSRLGTVFAASGFRDVTSTDDPNVLSIRDWALVRVDARRATGKNTFKVSKVRFSKIDCMFLTGWLHLEPTKIPGGRPQ